MSVWMFAPEKDDHWARWARAVYIAGPTWFDARAIAQRIFGEAGALHFEPMTSDTSPDIEIEWRGHDATQRQGRRRFIRERKGKKWGAWKEDRT